MKYNKLDFSVKILIISFVAISTAFILALSINHAEEEKEFTNEEFITMLNEEEDFLSRMEEQKESYQLIVSLASSPSSLIAVAPQIKTISDDFTDEIKLVQEDNLEKLTEEQLEVLESLKSSNESLSESMSLLHKGLVISDTDLIYEAGIKLNESSEYLESISYFFEED